METAHSMIAKWAQQKLLETKYRDIADGNEWGTTTSKGLFPKLETKYHDIADGNDANRKTCPKTHAPRWKASTAISRIQNRSIDGIEPLYWVVTKRCVYYKRLVLYIVHTPTKQIPTRT